VLAHKKILSWPISKGEARELAKPQVLRAALRTYKEKQGETRRNKEKQGETRRNKEKQGGTDGA